MNAGRGHVLSAAALLVLVTLVAGPACGVSIDRTSGCSDTTAQPGDCVRWAGFPSIDGLRLTSVTTDSGIDRRIRFTLRGRPADINNALRSANFTSEFGDFNSTSLAPASATTYSLFADDDPDGYLNGQNERVHRHIARGDLPKGEELLYVEAFTT